MIQFITCPICEEPDEGNTEYVRRLREGESDVFYCSRCFERYRVTCVDGLADVEAVGE